MVCRRSDGALFAFSFHHYVDKQWASHGPRQRPISYTNNIDKSNTARCEISCQFAGSIATTEKKHLDKTQANTPKPITCPELLCTHPAHTTCLHIIPRQSQPEIIHPQFLRLGEFIYLLVTIVLDSIFPWQHIHRLHAIVLAGMRTPCLPSSG